MIFCRLFDFACRCTHKMKALVLLIVTVVVLSSSVVPAQDVHDTSASLRSNNGIKKQEHQSESQDELVDDSVADAVDEDTDEESLLESTQIETLDDIRVENHHVESEGDDPASEFQDSGKLEEESLLESTQIETLDDIRVENHPVESEGDDPASEFQDSGKLESENKETPAADKIPPADEQQVTAFPPPFDQDMIDSSKVAQVANSVVLLNVDVLSRHCKTQAGNLR